MAKNKKQDEVVENDEFGSVNLDVESIDEPKPVEELVIVPQPLALKYEFAQAFRLYKKQNELATTWTDAAVLVFCQKRNSNKLNSLDTWFEVFNQY